MHTTWTRARRTHTRHTQWRRRCFFFFFAPLTFVIGCNNNHLHLPNWLNAAIFRCNLCTLGNKWYASVSRKMKFASIQQLEFSKSENLLRKGKFPNDARRSTKTKWTKFKLTKSNCKCPKRSIHPYPPAHIQSIRCMWMAASLAWKIGIGNPCHCRPACEFQFSTYNFGRTSWTFDSIGTGAFSSISDDVASWIILSTWSPVSVRTRFTSGDKCGNSFNLKLYSHDKFLSSESSCCCAATWHRESNLNSSILFKLSAQN